MAMLSRQRYRRIKSFSLCVKCFEYYHCQKEEGEKKILCVGVVLWLLPVFQSIWASLSISDVWMPGAHTFIANVYILNTYSRELQATWQGFICIFLSNVWQHNIQFDIGMCQIPINRDENIHFMKTVDLYLLNPLFSISVLALYILKMETWFWWGWC